jgi:hypothetical protein
MIKAQRQKEVIAAVMQEQITTMLALIQVALTDLTVVVLIASEKFNHCFIISITFILEFNLLY